MHTLANTNNMKKRTRRIKKPVVTEIAELNVERMQVSQLKPHPKNPRKHPKPGTPEWDTLRASLEHDYFDPLVFNTRNSKLVSGHLRRKVFMAMGIKQADVVVVDYDESTHLARMIAANKSIGEDDLFKLGAIMEELGEVNAFDLSLTGFTLAEVDGLRAVDEDAEPEEGSEAESGYTRNEVASIVDFFGEGATPDYEVKANEVWRIGNHYMYVGSVLTGHPHYMPLLERLKTEFPDRQVVLAVVPDPLMLHCVDERVVAVFVQPSPRAAALGMSLLHRKDPKVKIELHTNNERKTKAKKKARNS